MGETETARSPNDATLLGYLAYWQQTMPSTCAYMDYMHLPEAAFTMVRTMVKELWNKTVRGTKRVLNNETKLKLHLHTTKTSLGFKVKTMTTQNSINGATSL